MTVPPLLVRTARFGWQWQWQLLMNGLAPADDKGRFRRAEQGYRSVLGEAPFSAEPDRYVLIVGESCPWAHRCWLLLALRDLLPVVALRRVRPDPHGGRWVFGEPFEGCSSLADLYGLCQVRAAAGSNPRATVPVLWDRHTRRIVNNESSELIVQLNRAFDAGPAATVGDLEPAPLRPRIEQWSQLLQQRVNNGVYQCGFARTQAAYDEASTALFSALDALEQALADGRPWLCGEQLSLADVRLFPSLARWEAAYASLFRCLARPLWSFPSLWNWRSRFFGLNGVAATCPSEAWRRDYFASLFPLNPSGLVPSAPTLATLVEWTPPQQP